MRQAERIIIEGMDGAGKTTLVDALVERVGNMEVVRNELGPAQDFNTWWPEQLDREAGPIVPVHDRFYYSELIYGPILRGHIAAEPVLLQNALWFLRTTSLLIYARPNSDRLRKGIDSNPQMEGVSHRFTQLLEFYDQVMEAEREWYGNRFVHYVWHREGELDRVEGIVRSYLKGEIR